MSEIKVNKISPRTACGTTTLGDSGDTFTIPAGVSITNSGTASGFGATGSASWNTTVKTGDFTAVAGEGYFVDTTSQEIDVALPAGSAGDVVAVADYANTFDTNNCILKQNGSDKIEGSTDDFVVNIEGSALTLVFVDSTKGWIVTDSGNSTDGFENKFIVATGGTESTSGNCKIHTFTSPGTFEITNLSPTPANNALAYMVIAGGGAGGGSAPCSTGGTGGGGAGGFREGRNNPITPYTASPLAASCSALTATLSSFPITIGAGGAGAAAGTGSSGSSSTFSTITSAGGGGAGGRSPSPGVGNGLNGGSGGGGGWGSGGSGSAGTGNTPPVSPPQGNAGAAYSAFESGSRPGGGGGAGAAGFPAGANDTGGNGGTGITSSINGTPTTRAGGGGGGANTSGSGGPGGGGGGNPGPGSATAGTANTGGGGGGHSGNGAPSNTTGAAGGSGIVIIRYKFQ